MGGPASQAADYLAPGLQIIVHVCCELDVPPCHYFEVMLHPCENAPRSGDCRGDTEQQPQVLASFSQLGRVRLPGYVR